MVLHELATNAAKHGAFSAPGGQVEVTWARDPVDGGLWLDWRESGGPPISTPPPSDGRSGGFGSRLVARTARHLGGSIDFTWEPTGMRCRLRLPADRLGAAVMEDATGAT